ncbi:D-alanine--D-alanine ligase [Streptomyces niveus]|uniref:D-alanine--D-alanine ligase family protein n=1 Tax=Streptomyces niveus TaxID=193462 RepID=UPI0034404C78
MSVDLSSQRIGVLFGGNSPERAGSVASAEAAAKALSMEEPSVELIDLQGIDLGSLADRIDVALLASHGLGGEDGKIQGALDTLYIPYTGSGVKASAVGMHKLTVKRMATGAMIDTPRWVEVHPSHTTVTTVSMARQSLGFPVFVKPVSGGGSLEAAIARDEHELTAVLERTRTQPYAEYLIEEFVPGIPCSVGVLEVDGKLTTLPIHSAETDREFYDYEAKHDRAQRRETCPADLPHLKATRLSQLALRVHRLIGAHGLSRVDFLLDPCGRMPMLEINTVPGLSEHGNLATMAAAAGMSYGDLVRHVLATAFTKPAYVP